MRPSQSHRNAFLNQLAVLPYIINGIFILFTGEDGLYWIVAAIDFSFIKAVSEAWILLAEINR